MRVAIPVENDHINQQFGESDAFKLYDIEGGVILKSQEIHAGCTGYEAIVQFLQLAKCGVVICGGIGGPVKAALLGAGIMFYPGVIGTADTAAKLFAEGRLSYNETGSCHHMDAGGGCPHLAEGGDCGTCSGCSGHTHG